MNDADRTPDELRAWLTEIGDMAALLPDAAIARSPHAEGTRPVPGSRPPIKLDVVHLLDTRDKPAPGIALGMGWTHGMHLVDPDRIGILPYLDGWVRDIETSLLDQHPDVPDDVPDVPTVANCVAWLHKHADAAATLPQWPEIAYGLRILHRNMRTATAGVRDVEQRPVPCARCGDPLRHVDGEVALWTCPSGHETKVQAVTINQAAKITGMRKDDLYSFANRPGLLREMGIEPMTPVLGETGDRKLFDLGDIRRVVAEIRMRKTG